MADDPHRDLLPVRDGSFVESYRSIIAMSTDPRERHTISKIDRDDLEDKYLRLLEECQDLRKLSNSQEDKIKRLGTKLMRVSATPRTFTTASLDVNSDKNKIDLLKMENIKLKDKIVVLRNQILSHRSLRRSPSQTRRLMICTSSRPTTCCSESGRIKSSTCQNFINDRDDGIITRTYVDKISELEKQRKQMIDRIDELENRLALSQSEIQKDKIAENVEYIRVRREMKLGHEKLMEAEAMKKVLCAQVQEMKNLLDETIKNNEKIAVTLDAEKKRSSEMNERVTRSQDNQLREKDEHIRDLMNEIKILQQHNSELLNLSTKYSHVEMENSELKKKLSGILADNHNLKSSFDNEQTNMKALQAANEQLMKKLQSTQSNIDNLTVQLKSMQNQHQLASKDDSEVEATKKEVVKKFDKQTSTTCLLSTSNSVDAIHRKDDDNSQKVHRMDQAEILESQRQSSSPIKQSHGPVQSPPKVEIEKRTTAGPEVITANEAFDNGKNSLSRDEMLKLLDEAQINTPLNTKSVISVRQIEGVSPKNYANAHYRQSSRSFQSSPSSSSPPQKAAYRHEIDDQDHRDIIEQISKILEDYFRTHFNETVGDPMTLFRSNLLSKPNNSINIGQPSTDDKLVFPTSPHEPYDLYDQNNNKMPSNTHCANMKHSSIHHWSSEDEMLCMNKSTMYQEFGESEQCICVDNERCYEYCQCCSGDRKCEIKISHHTFFTAIRDINASGRKTINDNLTSRPMSKTKQVITRLCCEPDHPMKAACLKNSPVAIPSYSPATNPENIRKCQRSCPVANMKKTDEIHHIDERDGNNGHRANTPRRYSPILITDQEGLVEIHILSLRFSPLVEESLFTKNGNIIERSLFISCEFSGEKSISTSMIKYPDLNFDSSCIYRVANVDKFIDNISYNNVYLQLHIVFHKDLSYVIAHGKINVKDIVVHPQNKLHYIVNMESLVPCYHNKKFGQLSLWIRLSCDRNRVRLFENEKSLDESYRNSPVNCKIKKEKLPGNSESRNNEPPVPVIKMIHERKLRNSKSAIGTSDGFNSTSIPFDLLENPNGLQSKKTSNTLNKEFKAQLTDSDKGDPGQPWPLMIHVNETYYETGKCRQNPGFQNDNDSNRHKPAWLNNDIDEDNDAVVIMIDRLKLVQNCPLLHNPDIHRLYIEFSFLGRHGVEYETVSVPIPKSHTESMTFNYVRKFRLDEQNHSNERNYLHSILLGEKNPNVQFNVVSEPLVDEMETEECIDVGHTHLNLKEHILNNCDPDIFLSVRNPENTESIGVLKISILGTNAIRQSLSKSPIVEES